MLPSKTQDPYLHQALTNKTKYCRVLWRVVSGSRRWFVQLMQEGIAPAKHEQACGEIVGLDIGPSTVAVVGDNSASLVKFCDTVVQPWKETRRLQRAMDRSKRATNPHCFNANGTWKKGQKFTPSKRYTAIRTEYAEVERKLAAERKRAHGELAQPDSRTGKCHPVRNPVLYRLPEELWQERESQSTRNVRRTIASQG
ncbi:MAG: hypothetical protein WJ306_11245 [Ferrovum myxofaciens]